MRAVSTARKLMCEGINRFLSRRALSTLCKFLTCFKKVSFWEYSLGDIMINHNN